MYCIDPFLGIICTHIIHITVVSYVILCDLNSFVGPSFGRSLYTRLGRIKCHHYNACFNAPMTRVHNGRPDVKNFILSVTTNYLLRIWFRITE